MGEKIDLKKIMKKIKAKENFKKFVKNKKGHKKNNRR